MRLMMQRAGSIGVRSLSSDKVHRFRGLGSVIDVADARDAQYILSQYGESIERDPPLADGWACYPGPRESTSIQLTAGEPLMLQRGQIARMRQCQQLEIEKRWNWPAVTPMHSYAAGMRRLLVTRDMGLGDMLMLCAALRELKRRCPDLHITLATLPAWLELLHNQPGTDCLLDMGSELNDIHCDHAVNLVQWVELAPSRLSRHRVDVFAEPLGLDSVADKGVSIPLTKHEVRTAKANLDGDGRPMVGVVYRGSTNARSYPKDMIPGLCTRLDEAGMGVALIDSAPHPEVPLPQGSKNLGVGPRALAVNIAAMNCIISPDSGPVHVAAAVGTPCIGIASTIPPELRWSAYKNLTVIDTAKRIGCEYCHDAAHCRPHGVGSEALTDWAPPCLRSLPPDEIVAEVQKAVA